MNQRQPQEREHTIQQKHFEPELIATEEVCGVETQNITEHGSEHANNGDIFVFHLEVCKYPEGKQSQQWSIGVGGNTEYGVDDTLLADLAEDDNDDEEHKRKPEVHQELLPALDIFRLILEVEEVDTEGGG